MSEEVSTIIHSYPAKCRRLALSIRKMIADEARSNKQVVGFSEGIRWGEPAFLSKSGSTIRMNWHESNPEQVTVFFNCNSKLVETFRQLYPETFEYVGNRAIALTVSEPVATHELTHCLSLALQYHRIKKLPMLGA